MVSIRPTQAMVCFKALPEYTLISRKRCGGSCKRCTRGGPTVPARCHPL